MLTKLICRNFKTFGEIEVELGNPVVFIGPNNSGKTTALQALSLWEIGLKRWLENRKGGTNPEKLPGVVINRLHLTSIPVPRARLLWRNLQVRDVGKQNGKQHNQNVRIEIIVDGFTNGRNWRCGLEFDYANQESIYCRPLRISECDEQATLRMGIPEEMGDISVVYLSPISGLASNEIRLEPGTIGVRIGEGRTADVLRNLCYQISHDTEKWGKLCARVYSLFGVQLDIPEYIAERGEFVMSYRNKESVTLDISSSGRGLQQTLLLLSYLAAHPRAVLLLDEPDAHLEILRQRQIYQTLTEIAREQDSQIIAATHSEVILNEAAKRDVVIAFIGNPHRIDDRGSQLLKSLSTINSEDYYQAEQRGWVLYLEGPTDLPILQAFAQKLNHPSQNALESPYVYYVGNQPREARKHFYGLLEAKPDLVGFCLFDRIDTKLRTRPELLEYAWERREIENYVVPNQQVLLNWTSKQMGNDSDGNMVYEDCISLMKERIAEIENARETLNQDSPWSPDTKVSTEFLDPLFSSFYKKLELPNLMQKTKYHTLVQYLSREQIDPEVTDVLDGILEIANKAKPLSS